MRACAVCVVCVRVKKRNESPPRRRRSYCVCVIEHKENITPRQCMRWSMFVCVTEHKENVAQRHVCVCVWWWGMPGTGHWVRGLPGDEEPGPGRVQGGRHGSESKVVCAAMSRPGGSGMANRLTIPIRGGGTLTAFRDTCVFVCALAEGQPHRGQRGHQLAADRGGGLRGPQALHLHLRQLRPGAPGGSAESANRPRHFWTSMVPHVACTAKA